MCGIVGIYNLNGSPVNGHILQKMTDIQKHRGPDSQGIKLFSLRKKRMIDFNSRLYNSSDLLEGGIGCNRLAILDLSEHGSQPMCNFDKSIIIAFNGEIYNAFHYRSELETAGFQFRSNTDTEIILYLYQYYGLMRMLDRLNGMFAICIVDLNQQRFFLVRDRIGIKPLYWYTNNEVFLFSSEVKSFLFHPSFVPELNEECLDEYFLFRYCAGKHFLIKNVYHLEPGHWICVTPEGWKMGKFWEIPDGAKKINISFDEAVNLTEEHLKQSIQLRLLSDVKIGCQLSGGIDSSLISVLTKKHMLKDVNAFSIIFNESKFSEEKWINRVRNFIPIITYKYLLDSNYFVNTLSKATWHLDEPLAHPNSIGIFYLAENARSSITVFLSGEGADELFGGYTRFLFATIRDRFSAFLPVIYYSPHLGKLLREKFRVKQGLNEIDWFILQSAFMNEYDLKQLRPDACFHRIITQRRKIFEEGKGDYISNCLKYELRTYLVDLLIRQDKMTMAHSIENRVPYLDHKLIEFVRSLPTRYLITTNPMFSRIRTGNTKVLLKKLCLKYFQKDFVYRAKSGFAIPLKSFFNNKQMDEIMRDIILPGIYRRGIINGDTIKDWWNNKNNREDRVSELLFICIAFEIWAQQFLDKKIPLSSRSNIDFKKT